MTSNKPERQRLTLLCLQSPTLGLGKQSPGLCVAVRRSWSSPRPELVLCAVTSVTAEFPLVWGMNRSLALCSPGIKAEKMETQVSWVSDEKAEDHCHGFLMAEAGRSGKNLDGGSQPGLVPEPLAACPSLHTLLLKGPTPWAPTPR